jgi:sodium/hydrogen antiporter
MTELDIALTVVGGLVLFLGLLSRPLERLPLGAPLIALLLGVALGPQAIGLLDPSLWVGDTMALLEQGARLTIAIGLMAIALHLPPDFLSRDRRSLAVMLLLVMPIMALCGGLLAHWLLGVPIMLALLVGAVLCPTDPIVATSIVTGAVAERSLPQRMRDLLLGESGANDGLAFPLVWLPLLLILHGAAAAWQEWLLHTMLWQVGGAIAGGALLGHAAGRLLTLAEKRHTIEVASFFAYTIALTLLTLGAAELAGTDSILAVFACGVAFARAVGGHERRQEERVQEAINGFFTLPIFVLIGLTIPWQAWMELGWRGAAFAALIVLLRRLPAVVLLSRLAPALKGRRDALFAGWFGPIGIAALFYAMVAVRHTGEDFLWALASLAICASVLAHGVTGAPFTLLYARYAGTARPGKA